MNRKELLKRIKQAASGQETSLDLADKGIKELPPEIGQLTHLTKLFLHSNKLTSLPPEIGQLSQLKTLQLDDNGLTSIPSEIGRLTNLELLSLDGNKLASIPPSIGNLSCLNTLFLGDTVGGQEVFGELLPPAGLSQPTITTTNPLKTLPPELGRLEALETLKLDGIELTNPPPEVVAQGTEAVLTYLREQLEEETLVWESRLLVVGEGGVGKTQILRALNGHEFQIDSETTHGIAIVPLQLEHPTHDDVTMTLNAWDFGGQEVYHATHQFFLAKRSLFLLVWNSRLGWEQGKLHNWLDTIKALAPESPVMLVSTHLDERAADLPLNELKRKHSQIAGAWSVSSLKRELGDGIEGLRQALQTIAAGLPLMGKPTPTSFLNTTSAIRKLKQTEMWIHVSQLWEIMAENNVSESARPVLARQLHELGELIHFHDDEELRDIVLLDAEWVTRNISNVLEHDGIVDGLGIFRHEHMEECWPQIESTLRERFLRLMERFDLSYRIPDDPEDRSLVVERLSYDAAEYEERWNALAEKRDCREIRMKIDPQSTRPAGIPTWFIARSHRFTTNTHWRFGALFQDKPHCRHLGLVEAPSADRFVRLTVRGPNPYNFFTVLRDGLELTLARFPGLQLKRTMPCPGKNRNDPEGPCAHEFNLADLEDRMQCRPPKLEIECPKCYSDVSVTELLFGLHWTTESKVLQRLDERFDELEVANDQRNQRLLGELADLRELTQRQFTYQFNRDQRLEESHCPSVFSLRPEARRTWPKAQERLFSTKWTLQLYCEAPGCWHPAPAGGEYTIDEPVKWKSTVAPYLSALVKVFKYVAPLVGAGIGYASEDLGKLLAADVKLMKALVDKLPDMTSVRDLKAEHGMEISDKARALGGASLRGLRRLLTELDPQQNWGGLAKMLTPEGHWLWLCNEHAQVYRR